MLAISEITEYQLNLESVAELADEIVLITPEDPEKFNHLNLKTEFKIIQLDLEGEPSLARNEALKHAKGDWILWIDTNEQIPRTDQQIIRNLLSAEKNKAFYFHFYQSADENLVWLQLRMFPNLPGIKFERPYCEDISQSALNLRLHLVNSGVKITQAQPSLKLAEAKENPAIFEKMEAWNATHSTDYFSKFFLGLNYFKLQNYNAAINNFNQLIENLECKKNAHLIYLYSLIFKAKALIAIEQFQQAAESLKIAQNLDSHLYLIYLTQGELYTELKNPEKALEYLRKCTGIQLKPSIIPLNLVKLQGLWYFLVGKNWMTLKDYDQAILHFKKAKMFLPDYPELLRVWVQCYRALEQFHNAHALMESILILDAENILNHIDMGYLLVEMNDLQSAKTHFENALTLNKQSTKALSGLALVFQLSGDSDKAIRTWQNVTRMNPKDQRSWIELGYLLIKQNRLNDAETALLNAQKYQSLPLTASLALIFLYASKNQFAKLLLAYRNVLKMLNGSFTILQITLENVEKPDKMASEFLNLAVHLISQGSLDAACFSLQTANQLAPEQHKTSAMLADLYYNQQEFTRAIHLLEKLVLKEPQNSAHLRKLGDCYLKMKIDKAAKMCYWRARELDNYKNTSTPRMAMDG